MKSRILPAHKGKPGAAAAEQCVVFLQQMYLNLHIKNEGFLIFKGLASGGRVLVSVMLPDTLRLFLLH